MQAAVRHAVRTGLPLSVKGGAHGVAGLALVDDGLIASRSLRAGWSRTGSPRGPALSRPPACRRPEDSHRVAPAANVPTMRLHVCWGTWRRPGMGPGGTHFCGTAYHALRGAGHDPQVVKTYGLGVLGSSLNPTRREVERLTGNRWVPVLELDDGTVVDGTDAIVAWATTNPA